MTKPRTVNILMAALWIAAAPMAAEAGDVRILAAEFQRNSTESWSVSVTLKHGDRGWDHYADNWRVVDSEGKVLGVRVLYHPHVNEQPFTRGLSNVNIPVDATIVYIEVSIA